MGTPDILINCVGIAQPDYLKISRLKFLTKLLKPIYTLHGIRCIRLFLT
jgi:hypothetical protein